MSVSRTNRDPAATRPGPDTPLGRLFRAPIRPGAVAWLGIRRGRRVPMEPCDALLLDPEDGVVGDRTRGGNRAVTLIGSADLVAIGAFVGLDGPAPPEALRRNVVVRGLNLHALKDEVFRLGDATLAAPGPCHPCSRMEEQFGPGGYNAVRGHGGITARVLAGGAVRLGDAIRRVDDATGTDVGRCGPCHRAGENDG